MNVFTERKNILITGVSSGFGNALAVSFLKDNYNVYGISRRKPENIINSKNFYFLSLDLFVLDKIEESIRIFLDSVKKLDLVYLQSGYFDEFEFFHEVSLSKTMKFMDIHVWSNKIIIDFIINSNKKVSQIIASSSSAGKCDTSNINKRGHNAFSFSKAALNHLISQYAIELPHIHFCSFSPGNMNTPMSRKIREIENNDSFPDIKKYKELFDLKLMKDPFIMAEKIKNNLGTIRNFKSGSFIRLDENDAAYVSKSFLEKTTCMF